ncbi:hypothetical protein NE237_015093 [Protea cynaroides]|uniref:Uncharacterized protein n=1 Tax=Protea cynaroides TaxID=273540 RepID=A0A9Q0KDE5_9MAGN|nr:hypothetical protein NE237_015093 [Protea cynaroides]
MSTIIYLSPLLVYKESSTEFYSVIIYFFLCPRLQIENWLQIEISCLVPDISTADRENSFLISWLQNRDWFLFFASRIFSAGIFLLSSRCLLRIAVEFWIIFRDLLTVRLIPELSRP